MQRPGNTKAKRSPVDNLNSRLASGKIPAYNSTSEHSFRQGGRNMNKIFRLSLLAVCLALVPTIANAGGNELAYKRVQELNTLTAASVASGDYIPVYDASAGKVTKVDATSAFGGAGSFSSLTASGTVTLDDGSGASPSLILQDGTDETATFSKVDAGYLTLTTDASDGLNILTGSLKVGNGTPGETINGEDLYVEGISEFDGTANFDGAVDFDGNLDFGTGTWTVNSVSVNTIALQKQGRGYFEICGDATTVNNNTVYYGPSQAIVSSATVGQITCDTTAAGNTTEATADEPVLSNTAIYPLGMVCYNDDNTSGITYTLRSAAAAITPAIATTLADNVLSNAVSATATTAIAAGATVAIAASSTGDIGTVHFICRVEYAY